MGGISVNSTHIELSDNKIFKGLVFLNPQDI